MPLFEGLCMKVFFFRNSGYTFLKVENDHCVYKEYFLN